MNISNNYKDVRNTYLKEQSILKIVDLAYEVISGSSYQGKLYTITLSNSQKFAFYVFDDGSIPSFLTTGSQITIERFIGKSYILRDLQTDSFIYANLKDDWGEIPGWIDWIDEPPS